MAECRGGRQSNEICYWDGSNCSSIESIVQNTTGDVYWCGLFDFVAHVTLCRRDLK